MSSNGTKTCAKDRAFATLSLQPSKMATRKKAQSVYQLKITLRDIRPPEDCGGTWGYQELLEAVKDPDHPEHALRLEWLGMSFDPDAADLNEINDLLKTIPHNMAKFNGYIP